MAFDSFMYFAEPKSGAVLPEGETTDKEMSKNKAFEIYSFSWGASNPVTIGSGKGGASAGKVSISSFNVMKRTDKASAKLFQTCCSGGHFGKAMVVLRKSGTDTKVGGAAYIEYTFHKVFVESVQWSGSAGGDDYPTESVSFGFGAVQVDYKPQKPDGSLENSPVTATWSVIKNDNSTSVE
jgi:type VI secretion system secreted protein Hcp